VAQLSTEHLIKLIFRCPDCNEELEETQYKNHEIAYPACNVFTTQCRYCKTVFTLHLMVHANIDLRPDEDSMVESSKLIVGGNLSEPVAEVHHLGTIQGVQWNASLEAVCETAQEEFQSLNKNHITFAEEQPAGDTSIYGGMLEEERRLEKAYREQMQAESQAKQDGQPKFDWEAFSEEMGKACHAFAYGKRLAEEHEQAIQDIITGQDDCDTPTIVEDQS